MTPWRRVAALALALCFAQSAGASGDPQRGEALFRECRACHQIGPRAKDRVGPHLNDLIGRPAAAHAGFRYSKPMRQAAEDGLVWTAETLDTFLTNPRAMVPGTRMTFAGARRAEDRADLIAYLAFHTEISQAAPVDTGIAEILALDGDREYGEYLSSECTTCHRRGTGDSGIPSIAQWPEEDFVIALHGYRSGRRTHPTMQMIAGRLSDEEIAALAAYYGSLED